MGFDGWTVSISIFQTSIKTTYDQCLLYHITDHFILKHQIIDQSYFQLLDNIFKKLVLIVKYGLSTGQWYWLDSDKSRRIVSCIVGWVDGQIYFVASLLSGVLYLQFNQKWMLTEAKNTKRYFFDLVILQVPTMCVHTSHYAVVWNHEYKGIQLTFYSY